MEQIATYLIESGLINCIYVILWIIVVVFFIGLALQILSIVGKIIKWIKEDKEDSKPI